MERVRIVFLMLAVLFVPAISIYSNDGSQSISRSSDFSVFEENGKVGLKDDEGRVLIPAKYDAIGWSDGKLCIVNKVVGYQSKGLWGLISTSNKIVTQAEFLQLKPAEGSYLIAQKRHYLSQRESYGIITTAGKTIVPFLYDGLSLANMRAVVMSRSNIKYHFGLVDLSHKVLIPIQYENIKPLGSLRYAVENAARKTAIYSDEGVQFTEFAIDSISNFKKDVAIFYQDRKQGVIDRNGQMIVKPEYREVVLKEDGSISVRENDEWFFLTGDNTLLGRCNADDVKPLSPARYAVVIGGKHQLTDNALEPLHEDYFSALGNFQNDMATFRKSSRTGVIASDGYEVIPASYHQVWIEAERFRTCMDIGYKQRWVLLDNKGRRLTEKHYEYIAPFNGRYFPVKNRGYWGAIDAGGKEIITCVHDSLIQYTGEKILVKFKGAYGVMDLNENWVATPRQNRMRILNQDNYLEFAGKTTFLKSFPDRVIYFSENQLGYHEGYIREVLPSGAHWLIDMTGVIVDRSNQPAQSEIVYSDTEGLRAIMKDGKFGFIDDAGRLRIANRYESVRPFSEGLAAVQIMGRWGFIDHDERLIIQPVYEEVQDFTNGFAIVRQEGAAGVVDAGGSVILPMRYDHIMPNSNNRFVIRQGKGYGLADSTGTIMIQPRYDAITDVGNGYVIVQRAGTCGVVTLQGVSTVPMIYDRLTFDPYHDQFIALKKSQWRLLPRP